MNRAFNIIAISTISIFAISNAANAVDATTYQPGVIDKQIKLPEIPTSVPQAEVIGAPQAPSADDFRGSNRPLPVLTAVTFNGSTILTADELNAIGEAYLDRPITENDIARLKFDITKAYADKGNILVKVATPSQDLKTGNLIVNIYEGKIGRVIVEGNAIANYVPEAFAHNLGGIFNEKDVTEVINDLNEIKNINSSVTLKPGQQPITTDIVLQVKEQPGEDQNWIGVDNYGATLTGELEADVHLEHSNGLGIGEKISLDARASEDDLYGTGVGVEVPTGLYNTFLDLSYNYSQNEIGDRLAFLGAEGESNIGQVAIRGNLINNDFNKLTLKSGVQVRNHKSLLNGSTDKYDKLRKLFVEASYLGLGADTIYLVNGKVSKGFTFLGGSEEGDAKNTRTLGEPEAFIFEPTLFVRHNVTDNDFLKFFASAQYAGDVLLSSDLFAIGGYGSVRGFQPAQETGERGFAFTAEYAHKIGLTEDSYIEVGPWFDYGYVDNELAAQTTEDSLYSAGLGAKLGANLIGENETSVRVDWARPISDTDGYTDVDDNSFYFRVQQDF